MAKDSDQLADGLQSDNAASGQTGFLAEENGFDRYVLWRLLSWGLGAVAAVTIAVVANQSSIGMRRDALASADAARQSQQLKSMVLDSQSENRRLSSAIDTLNADRDRLYSRVTALEQGLDTVTGSVSRPIRSPEVAQVPLPATLDAPSASQTPGQPVAAPSPLKSADRIATAPPETVPLLSMPPSVTPAATLQPTPPDGVAVKRSDGKTPIEPAAPDVIASVAPPNAESAVASPTPSDIAIRHTDFGIDLGGAGSLDGLRVLWQSLMKSNKALTSLRPVVVVKENNTGLGMQLRLVAGPLADAAAAAKLCATFNEGNHPCETAVFDGQRLAMKGDAPVAARPVRKRIGVKRPPASPLSFLGR